TTVVYIRKTFNVVGSPQGGRMFIAADGGYEFYLNGAFVGTHLGEERDDRGDTVDVHDLFPENFVQGKNVLAIALRDFVTPKEHYGIRILLRVFEVEDITAQFAEPPLPATEQLKPTLFRRGRVVKGR
ncbi:MAG: hypothetical protein KDC45_12065, partial [Bacteroidetes bacterium]|nr:hypothetical protein [Bacteroidota bacterium]